MINLMYSFLKYGNSFFALFLVVIFSSSCSKMNKDSPSELGTSDLIVRIEGINTSNADLSLRSSTQPNLVNEGVDGVINEEVVKASSKFGDLEIGLVSKENSIHTLLGRLDNGIQRNSKSSTFQKVASVQSVASGVKYVFLIYDNANGNLLDAQIGTVGTALAVGVPRGGSFTWYAYSFNSIDDMSLPTSRSAPEVRTQDDKPLLYKSGTIDASNFLSGNDFNLSVVFNHVLPKLDIEIDTRRMFADIATVTASFQGATLATGLFNIREGTIATNSLINVTNRTLSFSNPDPEEKRIKYLEGNYYTANRASSFSVNFSNLSVTYPDVNNTTQNIATALFSANAPAPNSGQTNSGLATFSGYTPVVDGVAKELVGQLQPSLILTPKTFVLYGPANRADKGFQAVATSNSGDFIRSSYNFGIESKYIKVSSMTFDEVYAISGSESNLATRLANPAEYPDVVICSMLTAVNTTTSDLSALETYLSRGGVVFLLTEATGGVTRDFLSNVLNEPGLTLANSDKGGSVYELEDVDPQVLNGLFGDVRGAYWGQDGSPTLFIGGITDMSKIVTYTKEASNPTTPVNNNISMFRTKNVNLFYAGDTGFLAGPKPPTFSQFNADGFPYATKGGTGDDKNFPVSRGRFGVPTANYTVSNSIIFANVLAWLLERSQFRGINRNP